MRLQLLVWTEHRDPVGSFHQQQSPEGPGSQRMPKGSAGPLGTSSLPTCPHHPPPVGQAWPPAGGSSRGLLRTTWTHCGASLGTTVLEERTRKGRVSVTDAGHLRLGSPWGSRPPTEPSPPHTSVHSLTHSGNGV